MLINVTIPNEPFNDYVADGTAGKIIMEILEDLKPEAVYFTEQNGSRGATIIKDVQDSSEVPSIAEPWFMKFDADVEFNIAMTPEDLGKAGLEQLGEKWG